VDDDAALTVHTGQRFTLAGADVVEHGVGVDGELHGDLPGAEVDGPGLDVGDVPLPLELDDRSGVPPMRRSSRTVNVSACSTVRGAVALM
jgi:hypothetical protein